jgi:hypothetical protein
MTSSKTHPVFRSLDRFPWHSMLLALYAPLALLAHNLGQIGYGDASRSLLVTFLASVFFLFFLKRLFKDWRAAGLAASLLFLLFLTYGHLYNALKNADISGVLFGRHRYLLVVWAALAGLGLWWVVKRSRTAASLTSSLNYAAMLLVVFPLFQIGSFAAAARPHAEPVTAEAASTVTRHEIRAVSGRTPPDVYYIILDAYGRSDVLRDVFGYDNTPFLDALRGMGFQVAGCAQSNYSKTDLSLASSLNMDYVGRLGDTFTPENTDRQPLWNLIKDNEVKRIFENLGYTTVAFDTGFDFTELEDSDDYFPAPSKGLNGFEVLYLRTTLAVTLDDAGLLRKYQLTPEDLKRELTLFQLGKLADEIPSIPGPKFVFAHLVIPHQPFVFGPDGGTMVIVERVHKGSTYYPLADYTLGYRNQVAFISDRMRGVVEKIMRDSARPPVIIIQGDHGPSHFEVPQRMAILNAYYFPEAGLDLDPGMTPVNSFRLLFSTYFDADLDLLENESLYSEYPLAYQFERIPNRCEVLQDGSTK